MARFTRRLVLQHYAADTAAFCFRGFFFRVDVVVVVAAFFVIVIELIYFKVRSAFY